MGDQEEVTRHGEDRGIGFDRPQQEEQSSAPVLVRPPRDSAAHAAPADKGVRRYEIRSMSR